MTWWWTLAAVLLSPAAALEDNLALRSVVNVGGSNNEFTVRGGYDHVDATFGVRTTPGRIKAPLVYVGELCPPNHEDAEQLSQQLVKPYIFLVDRGGCAFGRKVLYAQEYGASAVVFADTFCVCSRLNSNNTHSNNVCESQDRCKQEPIVADGNSNRNFTIPSVLLFKEDTDPMKQALQAGRDDLQMILSYQWPQEATVHYDLWTTPTDALTKRLQMPLFQTTLALQDDRATFEPHQFLFDGTAAGCRGGEEGVAGESCRDACTNEGRYCAAAGVVNNAGGVRGADIVVESLRRMCLWQLYGKRSKGSVGVVWWKYVAEFTKTCEGDDQATMQRTFSDPECIAAALQAAEADEELVNHCMDDAGGTEGDTPNTLFDKSLALQRRTGVVSLPTVLVNGERVKAYMGWGSFRAICEGFGEAWKPPLCRECIGCGPIGPCIRKGVCPENALQKQAQAAQIDQAAQAAEQAEVQEEEQEQENVVQDMEEMDDMDADEEEDADSDRAGLGNP